MSATNLLENGSMKAKEVMDLLGICATTYRKWCSEGVIPGAYSLGPKNEWKVRREVFMPWYEQLGMKP